MGEPVTIIQYWCGCPQLPNSRWRRLLELVRRCREMGWATRIVWSDMPADTAAIVEPFEDLGCRIDLHPRPRGTLDLACVGRVYRLCRRTRCDLFHCYNVHTSPLVGAALAGVGARAWSKLSMSSWYEQGIAPRGYHRLQPAVRLSCLSAGQVMALSSAVRRELLELGVRPQKVSVVRAPVELELYRQADRERARGAMGWPAGDMVVATVGHAVPVKGWDVLIEAFAMVARQVPAARLAMVGSCTGRTEEAFWRRLCLRVNELDLVGKVQWLGQRTDVWRVLAGADVFAFPSRSDGQGLALTEAMAAGLPCVASAVGGIPEMVAAERNGLLFEREDAAGMARQLMRVLNDRGLRSRLGASARGTAEHYSMDRFVEQTLTHYQALLGLPAAGAREALGREA